MIRKDLLVKQMEEFGKMLALMMTYKRTKDYDTFEATMQEAATSFTGADLNTLTKSSREQFLNTVVHSETLNQDQKKILGILLFEKMMLCAEFGDEETYQHLKELNRDLYTYLNESPNTLFDLDVYYKLQMLKQ